MEIEHKFKLFHNSNPHIFEIFSKIALSQIEKGIRPRALPIIQQLRKDRRVKTTTMRQGCKIDTDFAALYARYFNAIYPELNNPFRLGRGSRISGLNL
jgi:hypothetical protein